MQILYKKKLAKISTLLDDEKQGLQEVIIKQYKFIVRGKLNIVALQSYVFTTFILYVSILYIPFPFSYNTPHQNNVHQNNSTRKNLNTGFH